MQNSTRNEPDDVLIKGGDAASRDESVPLFQLAVLLAIERAPGGQATARQITDVATAMFQKRLDTAQAHIALVRLEERGLTAKVAPHETPRRFKLTERGGKVSKATVAAMLRVIGVDSLSPPGKASLDGNDNGRPTKKRHSKPFPSAALRK